MPTLTRRIPFPEWNDPERVFTALFGRASHAFWLDAGTEATVGLSYLGAAGPSSRLVTASVDAASGAQTISISRPADPASAVDTCTGSVLEYLKDDLASDPAPDSVLDPARERDQATDVGQPPAFELGWVGWFGYELGAGMLGLAAHPSRTPDAAWLEADRAIAFDHAARTVTLLVADVEGDDERGAELAQWVDWVFSQLHGLGDAATFDSNADPTRSDELVSPPVEPAPPAPPVVSWRHSADEYADLIARCQSHIRAGDAYQLCLTNEIRVDAHPDPLETYRILRRGSPSHHGGLLRFGDVSLLSATPEQFLTVTPAGVVSTKPIKGTRPRAADAAEDARMAAELLASDKERAENLMIVDLMRNDLGKVARLGSVRVTELLAVESYEHVHQLVSTVEAMLADDLSAVDVIAAAFPAGSMTGAPKLRAMEILHRLEAGPRGLYAGSFGYLGRDGALDLAMVIRSIVLDGTGASIGTGGGITALSDPAEEIEETLVKARALAGVLGVLNSQLAMSLVRV